VYEDQVRSIVGKGTTAPGQIDFALLTDGLRAEREQGITIDVAYRYFSTARRKFIIADTPGHEQYTRNMATGASTADAADNQAILAEVAASRLTERGATRGDDRVSEAAMEDRKREGYF
jgi:sulfate adenylyltransferase subunit 1 (EFTu-like GTPase family)